MTYEEFLQAKVLLTPDCGFTVEEGEISPLLMPHQRTIVRWAVRRGRAAIFAAFGLGKTMMQLEATRLFAAQSSGRALIVCPLGVRFEFMRDAEKLGIPLHFVRSIGECGDRGLYITNYETVRDGKLDPRQFQAVSLDEAACLRGFGGTKTFRQMMAFFEGSGTFRIVATAAPSPNDFIELLAYSAFLDVMDVSGAKTKFFKRDPEHADQLRLMPGREEDFWLWCSTWAVFLQRPSDLGYSDEGYSLPPMDVRWHELPSTHRNAGQEPSGQGRLLQNSALGITAASREKRDSLDARVAALSEIVAGWGEQFIVWCDLNAEQEAVDAMLRARGITFVSLYGNDALDLREERMQTWRAGCAQAFVSKPMMYGAGVNLQQCSRAVFLGVGYKFFDFIQAIHRIYRFLQKSGVGIDILYTEAEREVRRVLEEKWEKHNELTTRMSEIIRVHGISRGPLGLTQRKMAVNRKQAVGEGWRIVHNDCVEEASAMAAGAVQLVLTSIPFSTQYEYSPSFRDFGHTDSNEHFWQQMDYLIPEIFRVLEPGRVAAIHVKDRITPSGMTGMGFQTVYPFSDDCIRAFTRHGFGFLARKTIVTDVVRENNQTYRLGWTEQCKDGSRMGAGMPEYLLLFRKPPTDTSNGYADRPVVKEKLRYTRSRWQIDAHGFMRSSGNRLLTPGDLEGAPHERIFKLFRAESLSEVYDFEHHVELSESLEICRECSHIHVGDRKCGQCPCNIAGGRLPATFMLFQPPSWHPDVWTDVARMRTLNCTQVAENRETHICPLQFDICDRVIEQFSNQGDTVWDPFSGLGTVPMRAVLLGRFGLGTELSEEYFRDSLYYLREAERRRAVPSLFDFLANDCVTQSNPKEETLPKEPF
jgi:DNA modification methylase